MHALPKILNQLMELAGQICVYLMIKARPSIELNWVDITLRCWRKSSESLYLNETSNVPYRTINGKETKPSQTIQDRRTGAYLSIFYIMMSFHAGAL